MSEYENNFMALATPIIEMYADNIKGNEFYNACSNFFNYSQDVRPNKLLDFDPNYLKPIGCAFAILSIEIDFGNPVINSISAENALYCLMTYRKHKPDTFGDIPHNAAVSLLLSNPDLMHDGIMHVLRYHTEYLLDLVEQVRFRSGENSIRYRILKYLIPMIFDLKTMGFKHNDIPLAPPEELVIKCINTSYFKNANADEGKGLFEELCSFCELGVSQP